MPENYGVEALLRCNIPWMLHRSNAVLVPPMKQHGGERHDMIYSFIKKLTKRKLHSTKIGL